jgi:oxygen-independent coproporphyrinogen-3 oxidase
MMQKREKKPLGLYIHIPFCVRKCRYCDFLSFANENAGVQANYVAKLVSELVGRSIYFRDECLVDSIYIGGGTPSLIAPKLIGDVLDAIYARFDVSEEAEVTIEANPGTTHTKQENPVIPDLIRDPLPGTTTIFKEYLDMGINRLSLGIQSFDDRQLAYLGRIHTAEQAISSYNSAVQSGFENINVDLIFGLPLQDLEAATSPMRDPFKLWMRDVATAIALDPAHISFYSLTIEEGTPIYGDVVNGAVRELGELEDRVMYHRAIEALTEAGYEHYEISNAAKPGRASRHNLKYWSMDDYLGVGIGAHSYIRGSRFANTSVWKDYMGAENHSLMTDWIHENTMNDEISEFIFLGLRKTEGIDLGAFEDRFGKRFMDLFRSETEDLIGRGLLVRDRERLRLTTLGLDLSNRVFVEFV